MHQITIKTTSGADAGTADLDEATFGIQPNVPVMHQVVTAQLAARRAGTQSTKTRSEVRGGGAKPYRQKGTGNARQGSTSSPHYSGGGVAHGPKPRSYVQRTPKKMIKLALRSALSDRASEGKVVVVDSWGFDTPKTKDARNALAALGVEGRALVVVERFDSTVALSFRNLPDVQVIRVGELNAYDVLCNDWIVFEQHLLPTATPPVEEERDVIAEHGQDPAEGPRDDADEPDDTQAAADDNDVQPSADDTQTADAHVDLEHGEPEASSEAGEAGSENEEHGEAEPSTEAGEAGSEGEESIDLEHGEAEPSTEAGEAGSEGEESS